MSKYAVEIRTGDKSKLYPVSGDLHEANSYRDLLASVCSFVSDHSPAGTIVSASELFELVPANKAK